MAKCNMAVTLFYNLTDFSIIAGGRLDISPALHIFFMEVTYLAYSLPTIPDDKINFYRKKLFREVSNLFEWEGLPNEIPTDYLERSLVKHGRVMFFYDESAYGYMVLRCGVKGYNLYDQPTQAFSVAPNDQGKKSNYVRTIVHKYDEQLGKDKSCVLINNMYSGESLHSIVDYYAFRMALVQQAFDTNALWQNIPVIFPVPDESLKQSIEKLFNDIASGKPWAIVDKSLYAVGELKQGEVIKVPFLLDKLYDSKNEVYNEFKQTIGIKAPSADKKERLLTDEVNLNNQITETCLEIMLGQRKIACQEINSVFGLDVSVGVREGELFEGGDWLGSSYDRVEDTSADG